MCTKALDRLQELWDARAGRRFCLDDGRPPIAVAKRLQRQERFNRGHGSIRAFAIGLVDDEDVGDLHDPGLERLHFVAASGHGDHNRDVGGADDVDFILSDAHRLDDHDVLARRIEHQGDLACSLGETTEVAARGHAADEHAGVAGVRLHPYSIAEDRSAREWAGRIDGNDADGPSRRAERRGQLVDERALAGAGRTSHTDEISAARPCEDVADEIGAGRRVVFDQGDGSGDGAEIPREHAVGERTFYHWFNSCRAITRR